MLIRTLGELNSNVTINKTTESLSLEFKKTINIGGRNVDEEVALDICQFANSRGGVILLGVEEKMFEGKKVAGGYLDTDFELISRFINDKVVPLINPRSVSIDLFSISINENLRIVSINIQPLASGLACVCKNYPPFQQKFPYRTNYGKKYFNPTEVEIKMSDKNRHIEIKISKYLLISSEVKLYPSVKKEDIENNASWDIRDDNTFISSLGESEYTLKISGVAVNIPFSLTRDVWITEHNKIGILLDVQLTIDKSRKNILFDFK